MFKSRNSHVSLMSVSSAPLRRFNVAPLLGFAGFAVAFAVSFLIA